MHKALPLPPSLPPTYGLSLRGTTMHNKLTPIAHSTPTQPPTTNNIENTNFILPPPTNSTLIHPRFRLPTAVTTNAKHHTQNHKSTSHYSHRTSFCINTQSPPHAKATSTSKEGLFAVLFRFSFLLSASAGRHRHRHPTPLHLTSPPLTPPKIQIKKKNLWVE